ncbi:MAG: hypothetical protein IT437_10135 [Phycisphaerales bacterium]|nr:hypothetical protein [Phycisphaerales bacterium]
MSTAELAAILFMQVAMILAVCRGVAALMPPGPTSGDRRSAAACWR